MALHPLDSQARLPYLEKISELAKKDPRYISRIDRIWFARKLTLYMHRYSELNNKIQSTQSDSRNGGWAIINDMSSNAGVLPKSSKFRLATEHSKSSFNSKLKNIPPETHTRVILFLACDNFFSEKEYIEQYRPQIFHPATVEILGSLYKVLPSFFYHILDRKRGYPKGISSWAGKVAGVEQYLIFGFEYSTGYSIPSCTVYCIKNATFNTGLLKFKPMLYAKLTHHSGDLLSKTSLSRCG